MKKSTQANTSGRYVTAVLVFLLGIWILKGGVDWFTNIHFNPVLEQLIPIGIKFLASAYLFLVALCIFVKTQLLLKLTAFLSNVIAFVFSALAAIGFFLCIYVIFFAFSGSPNAVFSLFYFLPIAFDCIIAIAVALFLRPWLKDELKK